MKKVSIAITSLGMIFLMGCQKTPTTEFPVTTGENVTGTIEETGILIQSFEDCLNAGFPIMESYPRQCNDGKTTYTEETSQAISGQEISGTVAPEQTNEVTGTTTDATGTDLIQLQQRLKAMMERRNQTSSSTTGTTTPTQTTTQSDKVTEDDIANLEKVIDQIIKK